MTKAVNSPDPNGKKCDANRAFPMPIPTETAWQNGMVARHGGVMQEITECILEEEICHAEDMFQVDVRASNAKNARVGRSGYSPRAFALGVMRGSGLAVLTISWKKLMTLQLTLLIPIPTMSSPSESVRPP